MNRLEAIIADLDPVRGIPLPEPDLSVARRLRFSPEPVRVEGPVVFSVAHRFALRVGAIASGAVAVVVLLAVTLLPGGPGTAPLAGAAAQLHRLSTLAAAQAPLGPGQWAYQETLQPVRQLDLGGTQAYLEGTVQTWTASDGSGTEVITINPAPQFYDAADQAAWVAAGSPPVPSALTASPIVESFGRGSATQGPGPDSLAPVYDVSALPTNASALRNDLESGTTGITGIDQLGPSSASTPTAGNSCASATCTTFVRALALLKGPTVGGSPALQAAILQALAGVSGIQSLGTVTQSGQSGLGFSVRSVLPAHQLTCPGSMVNVPAVTSTYQIVVNPQSGALVGSQVSFSPSSVPGCPGITPGGGGTFYLAPSWSLVQQNAVVSSPYASPGGSSAT